MMKNYYKSLNHKKQGHKKKAKRKAQQVIWSTSKEEEGNKEDIEEEGSEKEESKGQVMVKKTIQVEEKQIPVGSTLGLEEPKNKLQFKFTTKRPTREEELA